MNGGETIDEGTGIERRKGEQQMKPEGESRPSRPEGVKLSKDRALGILSYVSKPSEQLSSLHTLTAPRSQGSQ